MSMECAGADPVYRVELKTPAPTTAGSWALIVSRTERRPELTAALPDRSERLPTTRAPLTVLPGAPASFTRLGAGSEEIPRLAVTCGEKGDGGLLLDAPIFGFVDSHRNTVPRVRPDG
jgi:hypothetical protein